MSVQQVRINVTTTATTQLELTLVAAAMDTYSLKTDITAAVHAPCTSLSFTSYKYSSSISSTYNGPRSQPRPQCNLEKLSLRAWGRGYLGLRRSLIYHTKPQM